MPFGSLPANIKQCGVMSAWLSALQHFYGISPLLQGITCPQIQLVSAANHILLPL